RRLGSAVLYCAWVAAGRFDGYWEQTTGPWDVAAGSLLIEEAGGRVTDLVGKPLDLDKPSIVASNGNIHAAMLGILAEVRGRCARGGLRPAPRRPRGERALRPAAGLRSSPRARACHGAGDPAGRRRRLPRRGRAAARRARPLVHRHVPGLARRRPAGRSYAGG